MASPRGNYARNRSASFPMSCTQILSLHKLTARAGVDRSTTAQVAVWDARRVHLSVVAACTCTLPT
jgi:hypothetical protein